MNPIPLFPLPMAACPRELVPLHIFEERYKAMIRDSLEQQAQGGAGEFIIAFFGQRMASVGTVVRLVKVLKEYADGRMDVVVVGRRRCRIRETPSTAPYRCAIAEPLDDERSDWNETLATEAYNLHRALIQVITGQAPGDELYAGVTQLSFLLGATISLGHEAKQRLLESVSEDERLQVLIENMSALMNHVEEVQTAARTIQGQWELRKIHGQGNTSR